MPNAMTPLATLTLSATQANVTFSSITGSYRDLRLVINHSLGANSQIAMQLNGDTSTNYNKVGASAYANNNTYSGSLVNYSYIPLNSAQVHAASFTNNLQIDFLDYSVTDKHKAGFYRRNTATTSTSNQETEMGAFRWASTSAITSIKIYSATQLFTIGSTFTLYGIVSA